MRFERRFRPRTESARAARGFARKALEELGLVEHADRIELLVGELAVNAIFHARTLYSLVVSAPRPGTARLEMHDGTKDRPRRKVTTGEDVMTYGHGLTLIDATADRWGVVATDGGKFVWAEVDG